MKKYKLINRKTKEEHICTKVNVDGFDYYYKDEIIPYEKLVLGNWYYSDYEGDIRFFQNCAPEYDYADFKPIICTNNPNINISKVIDEVEEMAGKYSLNRGISQGLEQRMIDAYITGYNKHKETNPFSEEDMVEFAKFLHDYRPTDGYKGIVFPFVKGNNVYSHTELLELWKEQKVETIYYE